MNTVPTYEDAMKIACEITHEVEIIGPAEAAALLERNEHNPRAPYLNPRIVELYTRDMANGLWYFTAEPLQIDVDGFMLNGMHRSCGVVRSGVTLPFLVVRGLPRDSCVAMDSGQKRSAAINLAIDGVKQDTRTLAAVARLAIVRDRMARGIASERSMVSSPEIKVFLGNHPEIPEIVGLARKFYKDMDAPSLTVLAYFTWLADQIDSEAAARFVADTATRINIQAGDPVLALSRRFAEARRRNQRIDVLEQLTLYSLAWNARRKNRQLTVLRTRHENQVTPPPPLI